MAKQIVVAGWKPDFTIDGYSFANDITRASELVTIMQAESHPDAFYCDVPASGAFKFWKVDPATETVSHDTAANDATDLAEGWAAIRTKRDGLLAESDWMANSDVTMSDTWTAYRKALRDLPASKSDPDDIVFPDAPES